MQTVQACLLLILIGVQQIKGGNQCLDCSSNGVNDKTEQCNFVGDETQETTCSNNEYCLTTITLEEGLPTSLKRRCVTVPSDDTAWPGHEITDPTHDYCETDLGISSERTTCYYPCNDTAKCNDVSFEKVIQCQGNCSSDVKHGYCDYITGKCRCTPNYSGTNCETFTAPTTNPVSCIQCNEETDKNCVGETLLAGVPCQTNDHRYCAVSRTQTLDSDRNVIRSIVTRGCTSSLTHVDECFFSTPSNTNLPEYTEFTCTSTCEGNDCNIGIPDGLADKALYCYECSGKDCGTTFESRTLCPLGSTHCYSRVEYYISDRVDTYEQENPSYTLIKNERGCATSSLNRGCTEEVLSDVIEGAKRVVCQESCNEDGCNDGWPARPRCHKCSVDEITSRSDGDCMLSQTSEICPAPYHEFCVVAETKYDTSVSFYSSYKFSINRTCSYKGIGNSCHVTTVDSVSVKLCNRTCSTDGCNIGLFNSASALQTKYRMVAVLGLMAALLLLKQ